MHTHSIFAAESSPSRRLPTAVLTVLSGVVGTTMLSLLPARAALAQDQVLEEVVVTGIRGTIKRAQDIKRNAEGVVDAISPDELGKFSDEAISDAMQRIPGVQVERNDGGQEGDRVSIRGLGPTYVVTTINGRTALSSGTEGLSNLRSFNLEVVPPEMISGIVVKKTPTASDVESGLAGLVELQTRKPLDPALYREGKNFFGALTAQGDEGSIGKKAGYRYSGIFGARNASDTLGFYVSILDSESRPGRDQLFPSVVKRDIKLDNNGDGVADETVRDVLTIQAIDFEPIRETRLRESYSAAVQWEPSERVRVVGDVVFTSYDNASVRNRIAPVFASALDNSVFDPGKIVIDGTNTLQSVAPGGFSANENVTVQFIPFLYGNKTETLLSGLNLEYDVSATFRMKADFNYSEVDYRQDLDLPILLQNIPASQVSFNTNNGLFSADLGNVPIASYKLNKGLNLVRDIFMEGKEFGFRLDFEQDINAGIFESIEFGLRWTRDDVDSVRTNILDVGGDLTQADLDAIARAGIDQTRFSDYNFYPGQGVFSQFPIGNFNVFCQSIAQLCRGNDLGVDPATSFAFVEDVLALYGEANVSGELGGKDAVANFGLRAVNVRFNGSGARVEPDRSVTPTSTSNEYWELLPSANLNIQMNDNLAWRLALARVLSRPNPSDLVPREAANQPSSPGDIPTGQRGNANLQPTISWIFDTTLEYYTDSDGLLAVSVFYKDVSDFIFPVTTRGTLPGQGAQIFDIRTPTNFSDGRVVGAEFTVNQPFTFLPAPFDGFGVQANYTYADSSFDVDVGDNGYGFPGSSKNNFNSVLYYEKAGFGARLSYIVRDAYFRNLPGQGPQAENASAVFTESNARFNVNVSYDINDQFSAFLDVNNLNEEGRRDFFSQPATFNGSFNRERTITLGITGRF